MIYEILNTIFTVFIVIFAGWFAWESSVLVHEKKEYERKNRHKDT